MKCSHHYEHDGKFIICKYCGYERKRGLICRICKKGEGIFKKNKILQIKDKFVHQSCYDNPIKKDVAYQSKEEKPGNPDFDKRVFNFNDGLERVVEVSYDQEREVGVKLFFSRDDWSTFNRDYKERVHDNFVRFIIEATRKTNASLISGGNYDFNDDFLKGYTMIVIMKYSDKKLPSQISSILRSKKFGCLPGNFSIHAHLDDEYPTEEKAREIVSEITSKLYDSLKNQ